MNGELYVTDQRTVVETVDDKGVETITLSTLPWRASVDKFNALPPLSRGVMLKLMQRQVTFSGIRG